MAGVKELPYTDRLRRLNLPSLVYRRRRGDMIQVYKLKSGMERIDPALFFHDPRSNRTRGHKWKLYKTHAQKDIRRHCFSCRVVDDWNALPEFVINAKTWLYYSQWIQNSHRPPLVQWEIYITMTWALTAMKNDKWYRRDRDLQALALCPLYSWLLIDCIVP